MRNTALGLLLGLLLGSLISPLRAQDPAPAPWPIPEVCNDALLADYQLREELIFDLMMDLHECRLRYGGCAPGSTWYLDYVDRRWRDDHPEIAGREAEEREAWHREVEAEIEAEERRERAE